MLASTKHLIRRCADGARVPVCRSACGRSLLLFAKLPSVDLDAFDGLAASLAGVRRTSAGGLARWQYRGRLVARELDPTHVAVRVPFEVRDALLHRHPDVFSVPSRFTKHMMVVADLAAGDDGAVEDAVESAWRLQANDDVDAGGEQDGQ
jgi:hypothetical protein